MRFEWDPEKNKINIQKHGIDFAGVAEMFSNPMLVTLDEREECREDRWIGIGMFGTITAVIVFTERKDKIRIISARKATRYETKKYEKEIATAIETDGNNKRRRN